MRLLQLRFKNLNSLAGEWSVDLTEPAFAAEGIFAITGPTGAGKTTILDAVCLALYGRTPRLDKVNKAGNEILSRQSGDCFAEVTFETIAGRYRSHWSQRRARKRADGDLQPPRHEIADARSGELIESKLKATAERIERLTGMNFERFTRSMLLAQNGFAVFLQSRPDERAPILEQITGTAVYSEISIRVHERRNAERDRLEALAASLDGMTPLTDEEAERLARELEQQDLAAQGLEARSAERRAALAWLDGVARLEQEQDALRRRRADWNARRQAFEPERHRLQQAMRALEAAAEQAELSALRAAQGGDRQALHQAEQALPQAETAAREAQADQTQAETRRQRARQDWEAERPALRQARDLDLRMQEKNAPIRTAEAAVRERDKALDALRDRHHTDQTRLAETRERLQQVAARLDATAADEGLLEQLAGIEARFDALRELDAQTAARAEATRSAAAALQQAETDWRLATDRLERRNQALTAARQDLDPARTALHARLEGRGLADWRQQLDRLKAREWTLQRLTQAMTRRQESETALAEQAERQQALTLQRQRLTQELQRQSERLAAAERQAAMLETQLALLHRIQSLEQARQELQEGAPCPLCGALEHPFADQQPPAPDPAGAELQAARAEIEAIGEARSALRVRQAEVQKDLEQAEAQRQEHQRRRTEAEAVIGETRQELGLHEDGPDPARLARTNAEDLARAETVTRQAEVLEERVAALFEQQQDAQAQVIEAERARQEAGHRRASAGDALKRAEVDARDLDRRQRQALSEAREALAPYAVARVEPDTLETLRRQLRERRDRRRKAQRQRAELEGDIAALSERVGHQTEQIRQQEADAEQQRRTLQGLRSEQETLRRDRQARFGRRDPEAEERRLGEAVQAAEQALDQARQQAQAQAAVLARQQDRIQTLQQAIAARDQRLHEAEKAFRLRLEGLGFEHEADYLAARLDAAERRTLSERQQALEREQAELDARQRDTEARLAAETAKAYTREPRETLEQAIAELQAELRERQRQAGGLRERLHADRRLREQRRQQTQALEAQARECERWEGLHQLIGAADGKKYRNFAQGLTFEAMIGHANRQLQKMSDRYLLVRDAAQPLELNVIDNYQAGEIRSTKNLSGGESFIVSLALALGLSQMASRNVRVDSLFLDEGFGTLDEEALDTALDTLAGLRQEGKLIGVISHVSALKERIATRIQVTPGNSGRSTLSGPGCVQTK